MRQVLAIALPILIWTAAQAADDPLAPLMKCAQLKDSLKRLDCYDNYVKNLSVRRGKSNRAAEAAEADRLAKEQEKTAQAEKEKQEQAARAEKEKQQREKSLSAAREVLRAMMKLQTRVETGISAL